MLYSDKYDSDSGMVSRLRALSLASSMPDRYAGKVGRRLTKATKLSTSAPHKHGGLQQKDEPGSSISKGQSAGEVLTTTNIG